MGSLKIAASQAQITDLPEPYFYILRPNDMIDSLYFAAVVIKTTVSKW